LYSSIGSPNRAELAFTSIVDLSALEHKESDEVTRSGDDLYGGDGIEPASYQDAGEGVLADLARPAQNLGQAGGDRYFLIEDILGSSFADTLRGDEAVVAAYGKAATRPDRETRSE
jgi:hypothetical protein